MDYKDVVSLITKMILDKKKDKQGIFVVGVEGICSSGKSTLVENLEKEFNHSDYDFKVLEGDLFHRGRDCVHSLYYSTIDALNSNYFDKCDFQHILTWKFDAIQNQLLDKIAGFNKSGEQQLSLTLKDVLKGKENGTEYDHNVVLNKNTILLVPCVFLRHLTGLDFIIYLDIDVEVSVERKIERTKKLNLNRSFEFTRKIITKLEYPTMVAFNEKIRRKPDIVIDTNNWKNVFIKKLK